MAGWTTPRTWVASAGVTAAEMNAHVRDNLNAINGFVRKTADESVTSSTTLQNDDHLLYTISAAGTYVIDVQLFALSAADAAGDIKVGFTFPTGTFLLTGAGPHNSLASGSNVVGEWTGATLTSGTTTIPYGLSANGTIPLGIRLRGIFIATATGTLQLQWAQVASNASASTVKANSFMTVQQVA